MTSIEIKDCNDCLFRSMAGWGGEYSVCTAKRNKKIPANKELFGDIIEKPIWCPLKKNAIIIRLKKE